MAHQGRTLAKTTWVIFNAAWAPRSRSWTGS